MSSQNKEQNQPKQPSATSASDLLGDEKPSAAELKKQEILAQKKVEAAKLKARMQALAIGATVHYIANGGDEFIKYPAIVMGMKDESTLHLNVMGPGYLTYREKVPYSAEGNIAGVWQFIERAKN